MQSNTFIAFMEEGYFIFDIHLPNTEIFCELFEDNQIFIAVLESKKI